jgi:hypothetical protein
MTPLCYLAQVPPDFGFQMRNSGALAEIGIGDQTRVEVCLFPATGERRSFTVPKKYLGEGSRFRTQRCLRRTHKAVPVRIPQSRPPTALGAV